VVTNIVAFGAFVDIGVHQDGLVHVSQLADRFIKDPNDVVKVGQKVQVTVQSIDLPRNRIALTMRKDPSAGGGTSREAPSREGGRRPGKGPAVKPAAPAFVPTKGAIAPNGIRFK
jgi:uncharacterized protein